MITLVIIFLIMLFVYDFFFGKPKNYPPGPLCLPLVGSTPFVKSKNFHFYLESVKKQYGSVVGFKFGPIHAVGVSGLKEAKEVFLREEFQGRPEFFVPPGIMFSEGQHWTVQRRFTIRHLRDFGFGKKSTENVILQEAEDFFQNILQKKETIQVSGLFTLSAVNVLWAMIGGERFSYDDDELKHLLDCLQKRFRDGNVTGGLLVNFPILKKLFPNSKLFKNETQSERLLTAFLQKAIDSHKKTKTDDPRDFLDVYLTELEKQDLHSSFSERTLINVCTDLFSAGSESVGNTIGFCLLYCVLYPEWQDKIYEELESYDTSVPYLDGKERLPKVEAFLSEVFRCNTIASMAVPHKATRDTELNGYFIPKNTMMMISIWSILQDKDHWRDPENFRPERFLNEEGKFKKDNEWLPVFGIGKGAVLNSDGEIEMDAIIMEGTNLGLGSVGAIKNILHPVAVARKVLEKSRAAMLVGEGANRFAREQGFPITPSYKLITNSAVNALDKYLNSPNGADCEFECGGVGTVGAVVVDKNGKVACATSTGGTTGKPPGRLGDTPIPGSGGYADDRTGAVSTTGRGESIMRVCLSNRILNLISQGKSAQQATEEGLRFMGSTVGDTAGAITVTSTGDMGIAFISKRMSWAYKIGNGEILAGVDKPPYTKKY